MLKQKNYSQTAGFTIVELLIVIVVIAILATISVVAYTGIQSRANDSIIRDAAIKIESAVRRFNIETGNQPLSGSGSTAVVSNNTCPGSSAAAGWAGRTTSYFCSLDDLLSAGGYLPSTFFSSLPKNPTYSAVYNRTFMFYQCGATANNKYVLYYYLANPTADDGNRMAVAATAAECNHTQTTYESYGMRSAKIIQL